MFESKLPLCALPLTLLISVTALADDGERWRGELRAGGSASHSSQVVAKQSFTLLLDAGEADVSLEIDGPVVDVSCEATSKGTQCQFKSSAQGEVRLQLHAGSDAVRYVLTLKPS